MNIHNSEPKHALWWFTKWENDYMESTRKKYLWLFVFTFNEQDDWSCRRMRPPVLLLQCDTHPIPGSSFSMTSHISVTSIGCNRRDANGFWICTHPRDVLQKIHGEHKSSSSAGKPAGCRYERQFLILHRCTHFVHYTFAMARISCYTGDVTASAGATWFFCTESSSLVTPASIKLPRNSHRHDSTPSGI